MGHMFDKFKKDIAGILWTGIAGFLFLLLISYHPADPSFNSSGKRGVIQNYCGYFGSFTSDLLFQVFGVAAWIAVAVALRMSWGAFSGKKSDHSFTRLLCGFGLIVSCCSLLALYFSDIKIYQGMIPIGGLIGMVISKALITIFNRVGVAVIFWSAALIFLVVFTERTLKENFKLPMVLVTHIQKALQPIIVFFKSRQELVTANAGPVEPNLFDREKASSILEKINLFERPKTSELEVYEQKPKESVKINLKQRRSVENWELPKVSLLSEPQNTKSSVDGKLIKKNAEILIDKLAQFSVKGAIVAAKPGPAVTMYEFKPNADVKISKITELADDLSLALSSESLRIIAPLPGRDVVGIETSNPNRDTVYLREVLDDPAFWDEKNRLPIALGKQANGETRVEDLRKMPHLLVAGSTGSGKSVFVTSLVTGLLFRHSPKTLRMIIVDPKQVDLAAFHKIPHLLMPPVVEAKKAVQALKWAINEMNKRYKSMSKFEAKGLESFNEIVGKLSKTQIEEHTKTNDELYDKARHNTYYFQQLPYIVIIVEEFGDLMVVDKANVEMAVQRLTQMARACGIHLVLAMQSPRKDVVTGLIKTNIPGRISFKVASKTDSRIILDDSGAERLLARGDMLFLAPGVSKAQRHHAAYLSEVEITAIATFWSDQAEPDYDKLALKVIEGDHGGPDVGGFGDMGEEGEFGENDFDERYDEILAWVSTQKEVSASGLQRHFRLGYPRAARIIEIFEKEGCIGPANGSKPRQVLINKL